MCTTDETRDNRPELLLLTSPCGKRKTKTTKTCVCVCVRSLTSTSWWSSDPRPAAGLVSAVFAWLRPECRRREPRGLKGAVEMKEEDLDWLSNTKRWVFYVLFRLNKLTTHSCCTIF